MATNKHSKYFEKVKEHYDSENWDLKKVKEAVESGWITKEEFKEITSKPY
jgi:hypothetical protein